jgi:hypothetical protein
MIYALGNDKSEKIRVDSKAINFDSRMTVKQHSRCRVRNLLLTLHKEVCYRLN